MPEPKLMMTAGALPYEDGSGDRFVATVAHNESGMMLQFSLDDLKLSSVTLSPQQIESLCAFARVNMNE